MNHLPKIYIIGNTKDYKTLVTKRKIYNIEKKLEKKGFEVINPLKTYKINKNISTTEATLNNIRRLLECKAVYVMPEVSLEKGDNLELKISLDINLLILQGLTVNIDFNNL